MKPTEVKEILSHIISSLSDDPFAFFHNPLNDLSRNRTLSFESIIEMMFGLGGNSESFNNISHIQKKKWNYIIRSKEWYGINMKFQILMNTI